MLVQLFIAFLKTFVLEHDFYITMLVLKEHVREGGVDPALAFACWHDPDLSLALSFVHVSHGSCGPLIVVQGQLYLVEDFACAFGCWSDAFFQPGKAHIHVEQLLVSLGEVVAVRELDLLLLLLRGLDPLVKRDAS